MKQAPSGRKAKQVPVNLLDDVDEVPVDHVTSTLPLPDLSQFLAVSLVSETFGTLLSMYTVGSYLGRVADLLSSGLDTVLESGISIVDRMTGGSSVFVAAESVAKSDGAAERVETVDQ